jgi:serine protease Do
MIRFIASSLLIVGLFAPASPAQPEEQLFSSEAFTWGESSRSYLGVDIQDISAERVGPLKLKEERGVEVTMVDQDAPAGKAGIKEHDVILDFNGTRVESEEQLRRLIRETPPGRSVTLGISRDGNPLKINVQLADRGKTAAEAMPKVFAVPPRVEAIPNMEMPGFTFQVRTYSSTLGIQTESLSKQLAEYFGVKEGVLVSSVEKGGPAEKAGLKAGDVIVRADNERLTDRSDLSRIMRNHREGGKLTLGIVREKREQTVTVDLPARANPHDSFRRDSSEDFHSDWVEIQTDLQDMADELGRAVEPLQHMTSAEWRSVMQKTKENAQASKPAIDRAMRQAQSELRRAQKQIEQQKRELQYKLHDMI